MAATVDGTAILQHGTTSITGYLVQNISETENTQSYEVMDEIGDVDTHVHSFGISTDFSADLVALSGTTIPSVGDTLTYTSGKDQASRKCTILSVGNTETNNGVMTTQFTGKRHPNITLA